MSFFFPLWCHLKLFYKAIDLRTFWLKVGFLLKFVLYPWWVSSNFIYFWTLSGLFSQSAFPENGYFSCTKYTWEWLCMYHFMSHKIELLDEWEGLKNKMQGVQYNSAPSVSLLHACCRNANILQNRKENGYMLIWLINSLGAHRHAQCKYNPARRRQGLSKRCIR